MNLNQTQREQLARVLDYQYADMEKDYEEGTALIDHHIFDDLKALSDALGEFNSCCVHCGALYGAHFRNCQDA